MSIQNLRNKYNDHPAFIPLIEYCDDNEISFEIMKETIIEDYKVKKVYYLKVDDMLLTSFVNPSSMNNIVFILEKAYIYLGRPVPECLDALLDFFNKKL